MTYEKTRTVYRGMPFTTVLFIVFLVLKLTHTIDWSWWWVTSPLWIPLAIVGGLLLIGLIVGAILTLINL